MQSMAAREGIPNGPVLLSFSIIDRCGGQFRSNETAYDRIRGKDSNARKLVKPLDLYGICGYSFVQQYAAYADGTMKSKTKRFDMRLDEEQKALLERAAALEGQSVTNFVRSNLIIMARQIVERDRTTTLSERDWDAFMKVLASDEEPNAALKKALKRARERRG
jgi:uncharacterized protein (DUF1778 family)